MNDALMVCGTASDVGKTHVVTGLCRVLRRRGIQVAPFKAQNMALNSWVTPSGHEIGRAQGVQAVAAGVEPEVAMNPVLLKPTGERTSQLVVMGRPAGHLDARAYQEAKRDLRSTVIAALTELRSRFDVIILEGAGSAAEINLLADDIVNLGLADRAGRIPAILVSDIDRGGAFAALYGTVALLPDHLRSLVQAFVLNKFRGDPTLLAEGIDDLERRSGVPTIGVLPYVHDVALDAEDSLALAGRRPQTDAPPVDAALDVAAIRFPRIANFTDLDALAVEPGVGVRLVESPAALGDPDLIVLPGTKSTVTDLEWMTGRGIDQAVCHARERGTTVLGVCGGYQMLGEVVIDGVESGRGRVAGLGWLEVATVFGASKITRQRRGRALGRQISGYQIHHGRVTRDRDVRPWVHLDDMYGSEEEGAQVDGVLGTSLHGLFEEDGFRATFLAEVARRRGKTFVPAGASFAAAREAQIDRLADLLESHLDLRFVDALIRSGTR